MKFIAFCAAAALSLSLASCGSSYDNEQVKAINKANGDLTTEQQEEGIKMYIEFEKEDIAEVEKQIDDADNEVAKEMAKKAAKRAVGYAERNDTEVYKKYKDELVKLEQEKNALAEKAYKASEEALKKLGYE